MATDDLDRLDRPESQQENGGTEEIIPIGIARVREEWRAAGLVEKPAPAARHEESEPVLFPEVDGGAGVGDYVLDQQTVTDRLALSSEAVERLISSGELDSVMVQGPDGVPRRLFSESSFIRFQEDSAIDPNAIKRAAKAMADKGVAAALAFQHHGAGAAVAALTADLGALDAELVAQDVHQDVVGLHLHAALDPVELEGDAGLVHRTLSP